MRWMGVDYGSARIGIAVGSTDDGIASPIEVIPARPAERVFERISQLVDEYRVDGLVVGWPLNMDDTEGPQGATCRAFAVALAKATKLEVRLWDERLSTFDAESKLAGLLTRKKKKLRQDAVAAASILHDFLAAGADASQAPRPDDTPQH